MSDVTNIINSLYTEYLKNGYIIEDQIYNIVAELSLLTFDTNTILENLLSRGVIIRNSASDVKKINDENKEFKKGKIVNYENIYEEVISIYPPLKTFINKLKKTPPPKKLEWIELFKQVDNGNTWAFNRLVSIYMGSVIHIALKTHEKYHISLEDAIQDGVLGLISAINGFDLTEHDSFPGYYKFAVLGNIMRKADFSLNNIISFSPIIKDALFKCYAITNEHYCHICGDDVSSCGNLKSEIMQELGCTHDEVERYLSFHYGIYSYNADYIEHCETASPDLLCIQKCDRAQIMSLLSELKHNEEFVLKARCGLDDDSPKSLEDIGALMGVTRERVRQIEAGAITKLQHPAREKILKEIFDINT